MAVRARLSRLAIAALLVAAGVTAGIAASTQGQTPAGGRAGGAAQPRPRSVTLGDVTAFDVKNNIATVGAGPDQVRVIFYANDIVRI